MARHAIAVTFVIVAFGKTPKSPARVVDLGNYIPAPKNRDSQAEFLIYGEMAEWLKAHAWKACLLERVTWVRIPLSPPFQEKDNDQMKNSILALLLMLPMLAVGQPVQLTVFYKQKTEIQYKVTLRFQLLQDSPTTGVQSGI